MLKCLTLAGILLSFWVISAYAVTSPSFTLSNKHAELKMVQSKILVVDKSIGHLQAQQQGIQRQLVELENKIGMHTVALKDFQAQIGQKNQDVSSTEKTIRAQIERINKHKQTLKDQVTAAYHTGQHDRLKLMLNNQDPLLSARLLVYYDYLNKMRVQKVTQIEADIEQLQVLQDKQKQEVVLLNQVIQKKQAEQKALADTKKLRAVVLLQLHNELLEDKNLLNRLKANEHALKFLIGKLQQASEDDEHEIATDSIRQGEQKEQQVSSKMKHAASDIAVIDQKAPSEVAVIIKKPDTEFNLKDSGKRFSQLKGRLTWPVAGKVNNKIESEAAEERRGGVLIEAPEGNPVRSVAGGKVAFAGWLRGYGMLTIVNHGDGYMTVYAFNQRLYKKVGSQVQAGEVIASVGQSGGQSRVGLYFEIRKKGSPLNPEAWCKR